MTERGSLPVLSWAPLIQAKLACGLGNLRRTHQDFADVVAWIARHRLGTSFARWLPKSVRSEFRKLVRRAQSRDIERIRRAVRPFRHP